MPRRFSTLLVSVVLLFGPLLANGQETLRDPTRPYNARSVGPTTTTTTSSDSGAPSFRVTAIFTSDMRRVAVVNGRRVVEGDQVDGATVMEILADSLRLKSSGTVITRRVLPYGFRK